MKKGFLFVAVALSLGVGLRIAQHSDVSKNLETSNHSQLEPSLSQPAPQNNSDRSIASVPNDKTLNKNSPSVLSKEINYKELLVKLEDSEHGKSLKPYFNNAPQSKILFKMLLSEHLDADTMSAFGEEYRSYIGAHRQKVSEEITKAFELIPKDQLPFEKASLLNTAVATMDKEQLKKISETALFGAAIPEASEDDLSSEAGDINLVLPITAHAILMQNISDSGYIRSITERAIAHHNNKQLTAVFRNQYMRTSGNNQ